MLTGRFARQLTSLTIGTVAAQAINLAVSPLLTREFGPSELGLYGLFMSFLSFGGPIVCLSLPVALVLPKRGKTAGLLAAASLYVAFLIVVALAIGSRSE